MRTSQKSMNDTEKEIKEKLHLLDERIKKMKQERKDMLKELEYVKRRKQDEFYIRMGEIYEEWMLKEGDVEHLPEDLQEEIKKKLRGKPEYERSEEV